MTVEQKREFGEALLQRRVQLGLTQYACARHCGISTPAYQRWEGGMSEPHGERMTLICTLLGIDAEKYKSQDNNEQW